MKNEEVIIEILKENKGEFVSGEIIGDILHISRNAIWKTIKKLEEKGYKIEKEKGKGYRLSNDVDIISSVGIKKYLNNKDIEIKIFDEIDSTNEYLKNNRNMDLNEFCIVCAKSQSLGKGRLGRSFYSPNNSGLYFSFLLKPKFDIKNSLFITMLASVCVCRAIKRVFPQVEPSIKWVNDVYVNDKKVCGILTEAQYNIELNMFDYIIVGIGVNVYKPENGFPDNIKNIATYLSNEQVYDGKNMLVAIIINEFTYLYKNFDKWKDEIVKEYKEHSFVIGKDIEIIKGDIKKNARVIDIDNNCNLIVEFENGVKDIIQSGEISVKVK